MTTGDYWVQAELNIYETFHRGDGRTLKLPPDKGEGQHWQTKPGNLYSKPQKVHFDPKAGEPVRVSLDSRIPSLEDQDKQAAAEQDHFARDLPGILAFRTKPPGDNLKGGELERAKRA